MAKRKKKNKNKRSYYEKQKFYNEIFNDSSTKPGDIRKIAIEIFGSTYFTSEDFIN